MPGIVGIFSSGEPDASMARARRMVKAMCHAPFYRSGITCEARLGFHGGWAALESSGNEKQPFENKDGRLSLLFSGECFFDKDLIRDLRSKGYDATPQTGGWLIHLYEEFGGRAFELLNGQFSGILVDRRLGKIFVFNDRFGFDRIYVHEGKDGWYFASEAAALLEVLPEVREFDEEGVIEYLSVGCPMRGRTLFKGIRLMAGGSVWTFSEAGCAQARYFSPERWENQEVLSEAAFQDRFEAIMASAAPKYFESESKIAIALTAGLDSRMLLACRPPLKRTPICYTFGGVTGKTLDARRAKEVAAACGMQHEVLRVDQDFLRNFGSHVNTTVRVTGGYAGPLAAHEAFLNRRARELAPVRLTGVFGGEVYRKVSTFRPMKVNRKLLSEPVRPAVERCMKEFCNEAAHPVTFAAFREIPWSLFGSIAACRSQVTFRSPYLDNELVSLAYQAPDVARNSSKSAVGLIQDLDPALAKVPTDMELLGNRSGIGAVVARMVAKAAFKLDHLCNEGLSHRLSFIDPLIDRANSAFGIPGLHKFLWYRRWFRRELADYVRDGLKEAEDFCLPQFDPDFLRRLAPDHISGRMNYVEEINLALTLASIQRQFFRSGQPPESNQ